MKVQHRAEQRPALAALAALTASTTFFTLLSWSALTDRSSSFLLPLFGVCCLTAGVNFACRALGVSRLLMPLVEVGVAGLALNCLLAARESVAGIVPTLASLRSVNDQVVMAMATSQQYAAPIPRSATDDFAPLLVVAGVGVVVLVDLCVFTLRRVPLAGLPLLAAFTAPVSLLGGVPWPVFFCAAVSFVLLLAVDQTVRLSRWGRGLGSAPAGLAGPVRDRQPREIRLGTVWPSASRLAMAGVGLAVVAPLLVPTGPGMFHPGSGGAFGGGGDVAISNPMLDIKRNLDRGDDIDLVNVQREGSAAPTYLRLTVLDSFDGEVWRPSERTIPQEQRASGKLPSPPGLDARTRVKGVNMRVGVLPGFPTTWLPTPYPAESVTVAGDWRYDLRTLDIVSADEDVNAAGLSYDTVALDVEPRVRQLVNAPSAPADIYAEATDLPDVMPDSVRTRALEATKGAKSPFEEAVRLQEWFRETGGFTYSLDRAEGSGLEQLQLFIGTGPGSRTGYCEQFAAAMTLMARTLGIPARVAVGFLRPEDRGTGIWTYSAHDLHTWPELYFEGVGWTRFEPTPQDRTEGAPGYTAGAIPTPQGADPSPSDSEEIAPNGRVAEEPTQRETAPAAQVAEESTSYVGRIAIGAGAAAVVALLVAPRLLRRAQRRRRLGGPPVTAGDEASRAGGRRAEERAEDAWAELRATALDLGLGWDDVETLRRRARGLAPHLGGRAELHSSLESLVLLVERGRYAARGPSADEAAQVGQETAKVVAALEEESSPRARRRATWAPASLWRGRRAQVSRRVTRVGAMTSGGSGNGSGGTPGTGSGGGTGEPGTSERGDLVSV